MIKHKQAALFLGIFLCSCTSLKPTTRPASFAKLRACVVIDAGHGGEDSGALSAQGLKEKDLNLDIALRIKRLIKLLMPGLNVVMTREEDKALSLKERTEIANLAKGDLFISIHINSSENTEAKGFEFYSLDVTSDRHAQRLATNEDKGVNFILADLRASDHRNESDQLARFLSEGLINQISKKLGTSIATSRGYNQAIFQVLFVKMPAVLAELFFISNPSEERLLQNPAMRESCARGIVAGLGKYLEQRSRSQHAHRN